MTHAFWKSTGLLALGIALGAAVTGTPVAAQLAAPAAPSLKQLKKIFYTKGAANTRFATKQQVTSKLGDYSTKSEVDAKLGEYYKKSEIDPKLTAVDSKLSGIDSKLAALLMVVTANGVANELGCASGTLAVGITDGNGAPADGRFTFQVPGTPEAYGQIRSDGSIRNASANVTSIDHLAAGVYCIHITPAPTQIQLESAVASIHDN
jgi:hypothetical protein